MKLFELVLPQSKKLAAPLLLLMAVVTGAASADEYMVDTDPTAPCGVLHQIGRESVIYNLSNYSYGVKFTTKATSLGRLKATHVNAGVVKYLALDADGNGVWVDTGLGDYHSSKTYTIPARAKQSVTISYCADQTILNTPLIEGVVSFDPDPAEGPHPGPVGDVVFRGEDDCIRGKDNCLSEVQFYNHGETPYVNYNRIPNTVFRKGSLTILAQ